MIVMMRSMIKTMMIVMETMTMIVLMLFVMMVTMVTMEIVSFRMGFLHYIRVGPRSKAAVNVGATFW